MRHDHAAVKRPESVCDARNARVLLGGPEASSLIHIMLLLAAAAPLNYLTPSLLLSPKWPHLQTRSYLISVSWRDLILVLAHWRWLRYYGLSWPSIAVRAGQDGGMSALLRTRSHGTENTVSSTARPLLYG